MSDGAEWSEDALAQCACWLACGRRAGFRPDKQPCACTVPVETYDAELRRLEAGE